MLARSIAVACGVLFGCGLIVAGCGGSSSKEVTPSTTTTGTETSVSTGHDCETLGFVLVDIAKFDSTGTGFDYLRDRDFMDSYANRAPGGVAESVRRIRELVDRFASAAQDAGVEVNQDPSEDQLQKMKKALHVSTGEQAENAKALAQLAAFLSTSCRD